MYFVLRQIDLFVYLILIGGIQINELQKIWIILFIKLIQQMEEESIKADKHKQQEQGKGDNTIRYKVVYELKTDLMAAEIFKHVSDHFILPLEMERYFEKLGRESQEKQCELIDYRMLKLNQKFQLCFLEADEEYFKQVKSLSTKNQQKLRQQINKQINQLFKIPSLLQKSSQQKDQIRKQIQDGIFDIITNLKDQNDIEYNISQLIKKQIQKQQDNNLTKIRIKINLVIQVIKGVYYLFARELKYIDSWRDSLKKLNNVLVKQSQLQSQLKKKIQLELKEREHKLHKLMKITLFQLKNKQQYLLLRFQQSFSNKSKKQIDFKLKLSTCELFKYQIKLDAKYDYHENLQNQKIKRLQILFDISCSKSQNWSSKERLQIDVFQNKINETKIRTKQYKLRINRTFGKKYYDLAFQGGGAKGVAYIGAYKAIKQNKIDGQQIEIKNIMGSSAGGIVAIAASTGMSYHEMEQLCYKMGDIGKRDRIDYQSRGAYDQYGNRITFQLIQQKIKDFFLEFGLLNQATFEKIKATLVQKTDQISDDLLNYLRIAYPAMADIFEDSRIVYKSSGFSLGSYIKLQQKRSLNWFGILLHGALMKGDAIHDLAAQCLMKYFLKKTQDLNFVKRVEQLIYQDCWSENSLTNPRRILKRIRQYKDNENKMLSKWLSSFHPFRSQNLIHLVNKALMLKNQQFESTNKKTMLSDINLAYFFAYTNTFKQKISSLKKGIINRIIGFDLEKQIRDQLQGALSFLARTNKIQIMISQYFKVIALFKMFVSCQNHIEPLERYHIKNILSCQTYNQINSYSNSINFLDSEDFDCIQGVNRKSIQQVLDQLFADKIQDNCSKVDFWREICNHMQTILDQNNHIIKRKKQIEKQLLKQVSKITMKQYYLINPIQITFTAVDLDNNMLRLFNNCTTPDLPICKAVQITGSFPFAFKAQKWRKQWGAYYVHHQYEKSIFNLTGHEFTDGGFFANFPIRYFDNQIIRKSYFSHFHEKYNAIMIGFGLQQIKDDDYDVKQQTNQRHKKKLQQSLALSKIKDHFSSYFIGCQALKLWWNSRWFEVNKSVQWGSLNKSMINQIPLLRFISKILSAYRNADRNFCLQAFKQQILLQTTSNLNIMKINQLVIRNAQLPQQKQKIQQKQQLWKIKNFYHQYQIFRHQISIQKQLERSDQQTIQDLIQLQQKKYKQKFDLLKSGYLMFIEERLKQTQKVQQKKMSQCLIKMLRLTLKKNINQSIRKQMSYKYLYLRQIAKVQSKIVLDDQQYKLAKNDMIKIQKQIDYRIINGLFDNYDFKKIQMSLNFKNILKSTVQKLKKYNIDLSKKQESKLYQNIKQQLFSQSKIKQDANFVNYLLFDVTYSIRRMIKYLYLELKGNKSIINQYNYYELIDPSTENYLQFREILDFMQKICSKGIRIEQKYSNIKYIWQFEQYLWNLSKTQNKISQKLYFYFDTLVQNTKERTIQRISQRQQPKDLQKYLKLCISNDNFQINNFLYQKIKTDVNYFLTNTEQVKQKLRQYLKKIEKDERKIKLFTQFLFNEFQFCFPQNIPIQKQFKIRQQRQQAKISLINLIYGQNMQKQESIKSVIKSFKRKIVQIKKEKYSNLNFENCQANNFSNIDYDLLQYFYFKMSEDYAVNYFQKYSYSQIRRQQQLYIFHHAYIRDLNHVLKFFKNLILLGCKIVDEYKAIFSQFMEKYEKLINQSKNIINLQYLSQTFLIKYTRLNTIIDIIFKMLNSQIDDQKKNIINDYINRFNDQKCCLPLFAQDWKYLIHSNSSSNQAILSKNNEKIINNKKQQMNNKQQINTIKDQNPHKFFSLKLKIITQKIFQTKKDHQKLCILAQQSKQLIQLMKSNNFRQSQIKNYILQIQQKKDTEQRNLKQLEDELIKTQETIDKVKVNKNQIKIISYNFIKNYSHLIIEGVQDSSAFCAYFDKIQRELFSKKKKSNNVQNIWMITSKIFGFLLCLNQDIDQIRADLWKVYSYLFEQFDHPEQDSKQLHKFSNQYTLDDSYNIQLYNIFRQLYLKQHGHIFQQKIDYSVRFNDIRLIFQQQRQYHRETFDKILDQLQKKIQYIQDNYLNTEKAKQITKQFGLQYFCQFNSRHQYNKYSQQCKKAYKQLCSEFYSQFGSMLDCVIYGYIAKAVTISPQITKVKNLTKKLIMGKLMTTFKLKSFIFSKLQQHGLPYQISLNEFYERCPNPALLNFVVVNLSENKIDFLNKIFTPNMPIWAAIIASFTLPYLHRPFKSQKSWEFLQGEQFKTTQMLNFFSNDINFMRKHTFYNSSSYISSLPLQLLSNNTFFNKYQQLNFQTAENLKQMERIAFAFNREFSQKIIHKQVQRKFLNIPISFLLLLRKLKNLKQFTKKDTKKCKNEHQNTSYKAKFNILSALTELITHNSIAKTLNTVLKSNDNLILKWYSDKLIRLPIKIGTLDFDKVIDKKIHQKFQIKVASKQTKETLLRSEQITKTFIHSIQKRFKNDKINYYRARLDSQDDRYLVKLKVQFVESNKNLSIDQRCCKITFLNHSKWNQNMYNNFIIQYKIKNMVDMPLKRCKNSIIIWKNQQGSELLVRFYYLHYQKNFQPSEKTLKFNQVYFSSSNSVIRFSQYILDFKQLFNRKSQNSYEYQFIYAWNQKQQLQFKKAIDRQINESLTKFYLNCIINQQMEPQEDQRKKASYYVKRLNNIKVEELQNLPKLKIKNQYTEQTKSKYSQKYIQRSYYRIQYTQ